MRETSVQYVDLVTQPGPDALFAQDASAAQQLVLPRVQLSVEAHASSVVAIAGHFDCAANPVDEAAHRKQLLQAVTLLQSWRLGVKLMALWINANWQVEVVVTRSS